MPTGGQQEINFGNNGRARELQFPESISVNLEENGRLKGELGSNLTGPERELAQDQLELNKERPVVNNG